MALTFPSFSVPLVNAGFPPASQKAGDRPISFLLLDQTNGFTSSLNMAIRPEELTRTDVSRMTVQQTLGGAWADDFGPGLATINISGHTGWRGTGAMDGMSFFAVLKQQVFDGWHSRRNDARRAGLNPSNVHLVFSDALDSTTDVVAPINFVLRRSKSRPLLMQFQISMLSMQMPQTVSADGIGASLEANGLQSLINSNVSLAAQADAAGSFLPSGLLASVQSFMRTSVAAINKVIASYNNAVQLRQIIGTATAIVQCGQNIFHTISAVASLPRQAAAAVMAVAGTYSSLFCTLKNAVSVKRFFPDFSGLLGASNCSSTAGGAPASTYTLEGTNPFTDVVKLSTPAISVTPAAQLAIQKINNTDAVRSPMTSSTLNSTIGTAANGVTMAADK